MFAVTPVLPMIALELDGVRLYAWATALFLAAALVSSAATPWMLQTYGSCKGFRIGLVVFGIGSLWCGLAATMPALIGGRVIQGFGGGLVAALSLAMVVRRFVGPTAGKAIAVVSSGWGVSALVGPAICGGLVAAERWGWAEAAAAGLNGAMQAKGLAVEPSGWRALFLLATTATVPMLFAARAILPQRTDFRLKTRVPLMRLTLFAVGTLLVSFGGLQGSVTPSMASVVAAAGALMLFVRLDRRAEVAVLPSRAFAVRQPAGAASVSMLLLILTLGTVPLLSYALFVAHDLSVLALGYIVSLSSIGWTAASLWTSSLGRVGVGRVVVLGPLTALVGMSMTAYGVLEAKLLAATAGWMTVGVGIGLAWPHMAAILITTSAAEERTVVGSYITLMQIGTMAFGVAMAGMIANLSGLPFVFTPSRVGEVAVWIFATFALAPLAAVFLARQLVAHVDTLQAHAMKASIWRTRKPAATPPGFRRALGTDGDDRSVSTPERQSAE